MDGLSPHASDAAPRLEAGRAWPLGAQADADGVNIAVFSQHAQSIELCLFDAQGTHELQRLPLPARTGDVFHCRLRGAGPGLVYGLRAHGPWQPERGHRFNPHKLLLDPYAREIVGRFEWRAEHFGASADDPCQLDARDNASHALKARVVDDRFDWGDDRRLHRPLDDMVLYELHVKAFTKRHPGVPDALRGSYAGLASDAAIAHLQRLGITAVCLLPLQQRLDEQRLALRGLVNHWGYNTLGFFCVEPRYAASERPRDEFRNMVRRLHAAGIEVILDVVFNHTAETDELGPTIAWRGLDNASWYRLASQRAQYENVTGCGNTLDLRHPRVLQFVLDCLRYWVSEMHVDGFRFDLATVLGRGDHGFTRAHPLFQALAQDPLLAGAKLIAEPWDIGVGGYQLGQFPRGWLEWNDRYRDTVRSFWLGDVATRGDFARRLAGSSDLFQPRGRTPAESVNFIVAHDGFTLTDLVSYNQRHNDANGEDNRDGHRHEHSWNCGVEGPTSDPGVLALRARLQRALLATLLLSQGTPMLAAGAEIGHSQGGNNNPYCQDNETTWLDWSCADEPLADYTARLVALRHRLVPLANRWYSGAVDARGVADLAWLRADGAPLEPHDWQDPAARVLGALIGAPGRAGHALLLLVNAEDNDVAFALPAGRWRVLLDSANEAAIAEPAVAPYPLGARSLVLLEAA